MGSQGGFMYLDHGWQTLVDGLVTAAKTAGVRIILGEKVIESKKTDSSSWQVSLSNKTEVTVKIVVIAAGPIDAHNLFDESERPEVLTRGSNRIKTCTPSLFRCCSSSLTG